MDKQKIINQISQLQKNTMTDLIGIEITDFGEHYICGKMPVDSRTKQPFGLLHGGASAVLAETLGSIGGGMYIDLSLKSIVGIEINASHLKAVSSGWVYGKASAVRLGNRIQVWEINITDKENKQVCISRLTLAVIDKK